MYPYVRNYIRACEGFGWEGGPEFKTDIVQMANKAEKRGAKWSQSRFFASLPFVNISPELYGYILDMFEDRMGMWGCFLYRNPLRHTVEGAEFGVGDGATTEFQLAATTEVGGRSRRQNVYAIYEPDPDWSGDALPSDVTIYVNGAPTTAVTIDHDRGKVVFDSAPANGAVLTWDGSFSHWVRFNNDRLPFSIDNRSGAGLVTNGSVELIGVNPPRPGEIES